MKNILFVCVHNSGRSQMAEAFFNQISSEKYRGISAGTQPGTEINPVVKEVMAEIGIDLSGQRPKMLTPELVDQSQQVITMGCGVEDVCPATFIPVEDWNLDDPSDQPTERVREIRDQVKAKVDKLMEEIGAGE